MKVIGMMCVRDEADLLPEVLAHLDGKLDELYVYEDGSQDGTGNILLESPQVTYLMSRTADRNRPIMDRPNYHHLLEVIKEDYADEDVWVVITMGDRFYLNKTPRQIVEEAGDYTAVQGIQLDFMRPKSDPWTAENDTYPNYPESLRKLCRWTRVDERCVVAFKVTCEASYLKSPYPWPKGIGEAQYSKESMGDRISADMPFLEHQGRRSPRAAMHRVASGSRKLGRKYLHYDLSTFESTVACNPTMWAPDNVIRWEGLDTLAPIILNHNERAGV
jgi:hypothetical protein